MSTSSYQSALNFALPALQELGVRLSLDERTNEEIQDTFETALEVCAERMCDDKNASYVTVIEESRRFIDLMAPILIDQVGSRYGGASNLMKALRFMESGGNVLLVSNHTSGADTMVLDHYVNSEFGGAARSWHFMAGHVVNLYLLPLVVSGAHNRVQIFSAKYCADADESVRRNMQTKNAEALAAIGPMIMKGGQCVVLYPEGGRGEGALKAGEPRTMKIPQLMSAASPNGLMVLPSYVEATNILPVKRSEREFEEFLYHVRRGPITLSFGSPVMWKDLQPDEDVVHRRLQVPGNGGKRNHAIKRFLIDSVMGMIAAMAPEDARGPHPPRGES